MVAELGQENDFVVASDYGRDLVLSDPASVVSVSKNDIDRQAWS